MCPQHSTCINYRNSINKVLLLLLLLMKAAQSCLTPWPLWTIESMEFSRPEYWTGVGSLSLRIFPTQGSNPGLSHLQVDSLPAEPQGKPKNIKMGSLSLLQQIFLTQELNQGPLHCRQILYLLNYQGSPYIYTYPLFFGFPSHLGHHRTLGRVLCVL